MSKGNDTGNPNGVFIEGSDKNLSFRVTVRQYDTLRHYCNARDISHRRALLEALQLWFDKEERRIMEALKNKSEEKDSDN